MKIVNYILIALLLICIGSCDVDRLPETQISDPAFWKSESDLKSATNYLYTFLPGLKHDSNPSDLQDCWSDDTYGVQSNNISDGTRLAPATAEDYNTPYKCIRAANNILEKAPDVPIDESIKEIYLGEAYFFRALSYFSLVQKYGDVPLILKTLKDNSPELFEPRTPREQVIAQIYEDLDYAVRVLKNPSKMGNSNYGRVSKTAAQSIKARVALFEGTRCKYHNYGNPTEHLTIAVNSSLEVINSNEHDLHESYSELFQYEGEGPDNKENILVKQYGVSFTEQVLYHDYTGKVVYEAGGGGNNPTKTLVDSYVMIDGLPITKSPLWEKPKRTADVFNNRDERLHASVMKEGDVYANNDPSYAIKKYFHYHKTGFGPKKYLIPDDWVTRRAMIDRVIVRYAEVLLIYAEARYELEGKISDEDLSITIDRLRKRGGIVPDFTNEFVQKNGMHMLEEIRRERRVELAQENFRYWDLMRWKTAEIEMPKPLLGNYYFKNEYGEDVVVNLTPDSIIIVQEAGFRSFDPEKDYLWPLPIEQLSLNPQLEQNPKW